VRRPAAGDASGAVADLGVFVPLAAALVLVNGLHPGPVLLLAGLLSLSAGLAFGIPFPVQPLKALTALAVAQQLSPEVIHAAGLQIGLLLVVLMATGVADRLARLFTPPVIRSLQLAVGLLLMLSAYRLAVSPPELFAFRPDAPWSLALAAVALVGVAVAAHRRWHAVAALLVALSVTVTALAAGPAFGGLALHVPDLALPPLSVWPTAFLTLVVPQLPLTYGNAVVGVSALAREHFPHALRVTPGRVALSCGLGNTASALLGGMPMCHGSSGLSAHVRLGARTAAMNVLLGGSLVVLGLAFADSVLVLFSLLPVWALAGFLAYAGLRHALLVLDQRGLRLVVAVAAAAAGMLTGNLAWTTGIALLADIALRRRRRPAGAADGGTGRGTPSISSAA